MGTPGTLDQLDPLIQGLPPDLFPELGSSTMLGKARANYIGLSLRV